MLRCIQRSETDPYYNLAAEEYLMKTATVDTFMIWRNEQSVIIGKHQNASREINHVYTESHKLPVIRRITGGGAVYHDLGNINFSFIYTDRKENLVDFRYFTKPIILFLSELGLNAAFEGKNNIIVDGLKVSGNSAHIFKNKVLHHGTLLFNTDLVALGQAVNGNAEYYSDKSVRSVPAIVGNASSFLGERLSIEEFMGKFTSFILKYYPGSYYRELTSDEKESIIKLTELKYKKIEWNFGYSPDYTYDKQWTGQGGEFSVLLKVSKGIIQKAEVSGPHKYSLFLKAVADLLTGTFHEKKSVSERLKKVTFANDIERQIVNQMIQHLF